MNIAWNPHGVFIILFLTFGFITVILNSFYIRRFDQYPPSRSFPRVSILVPARNEARNIKSCVVTLINQDYPDFEVIVLDDNSSDATLAILTDLASSSDRLRIIQGMPLPEGWLGKHWACHQLYQKATGEILLFTDADTIHEKDMLRASVSAMIAEGADLVTAFPRELAVSWGERLLVPVISWGIFTFIPVYLITAFHLSALSVTIGQFMLFKRDAYESIGGYEGVRKEIVDDMCLGRKIISSGQQWRLLDGTHHFSCRMYRGFWEAVNGFAKSLFAVFDYRIIPYLFGWAIVGLAFLEPVTALVSRWLHHPMTPLPEDYAVLAVAISLALWVMAYWRFKFPLYLAFLYPISLVLFIAVAIRSIVFTLRGRAEWKDRILERVPLRWF